MSKTLSMLHLAPQTQKSDKTKTFAQSPATLKATFPPLMVKLKPVPQL